MKRSMESVPSAKAFGVLEMSGCYLFSLLSTRRDINFSNGLGQTCHWIRLTNQADIGNG